LWARKLLQEFAIEEQLHLHQKRPVTRQNLPDEYSFATSNINITHDSNEILHNYNDNGRQYIDKSRDPRGTQYLPTNFSTRVTFGWH
jgi:hypothetical protein